MAWTLTTTNGETVLRSPYDPRLPALLREAPCATWHKSSRTWRFQATPAGAARIIEACRAVMGPAGGNGVGGADEATAAMAAAWEGRLLRNSAVRLLIGPQNRGALLGADDGLPQPRGIPTPLWRHQRAAFAFAAEAQATLQNTCMGGGKTLVTLALLAEWGSSIVLVACPKAVIGVWRRECEKHLPGWFNVVALDKGPGINKRLDLRQSLLLRGGKPTMVVVNYEAMISAALSPVIKETNWDSIILDESHRAKSPGGKISRFCHDLAKRGGPRQRRLCLSGTPCPQGAVDLYGQFRFLDAGVFGTSLTRFRDKYCVTNPAIPQAIVGYKNQEELRAKYEQLAFTVTRENAELDLPPLRHERIVVDLEPAARKLHDRLYDESVGELEAEGVSGGVAAALDALAGGEPLLRDDGRTVTAPNVLVRLLRLAQVTGGSVVTDDGKVQEVSKAKEAALADLVDALPPGEPLVVFCRFREDLRRVARAAQACGRKYAEISGERKNGLTERATLAAGAEVCGVQWQAGGVGIDLSRAAYSVIYSPTYSGGDFDQGVARLHRPGQRQSVTFYHLVCGGTVDEMVYAALERKKRIVERIITRF